MHVRGLCKRVCAKAWATGTRMISSALMACTPTHICRAFTPLKVGAVTPKVRQRFCITPCNHTIVPNSHDVAVSEMSCAPRPSAALNRPFAILAKHGHLQERYVMQLTRTTSLCCVLVCRGGCSSSCSFRRMDFLGTCPCSGMTFKTASGYDPHDPIHPSAPHPCGRVHVLP
jgi:hypothetical protein